MKDLSRQNQELLALRIQLESERDRFAAEFSDSNEALKDLQRRFEAVNIVLNQLRIDYEAQHRLKDEELEKTRQDHAWTFY